MGRRRKKGKTCKMKVLCFDSTHAKIYLARKAQNLTLAFLPRTPLG